MLIGLVGKPNCGKSTFFKAATLAEVLIANYPFATIKPNHGVGYVKTECIDKELNTQCTPRTGFCLNHIRFVPVDLMDVAGLVPGASEGKGLGNQFLDDLRQADCFIQIVDASGGTTIDGKPVKPGSHDPCEDVEFLEKELNLWYAAILKKVWKTFSRTIESTKDNFVQAVLKQFSGLKVDEDQIKRVILKMKLDTDKPTSWTEEDVFNFASGLRRESKPMIIAANKADMPEAEKNIHRLKSEYSNYIVVPCSADSELALRSAAKAGIIDYIPGEKDFTLKKNITEKQKEALENIRKNVLDKFEYGTGVQEILNEAVFKLLEYIAIFPAGSNKLTDSEGRILPDCYLMPKGSSALDFAFKLHTDLGKGFIRAINVKTKQAVGKDYKLKHRDGIEIVAR